ncbi:DNA-binding winged helix-turn-helix (wHTH) protein/tetratricopeptide (TPR) repeat protein [Silvibacterium bohemicum]|uniref:DNA-binding winged helix-turn-helix (WHTH) protein/tetratricopeptide (TPR) repeat protein n=1 Tax=Silvibacterium bohemicum TaxID=1577686 RepID=A0A841JX01_9BACT|nr:winged helix-turn-helix domain-containing protein [Silvibacterium bohemicum]MBB6145876.1 DNA-binding winged helix-turn-helix (wHTH) protein/tetratricopeptide (TPR) repeat protein [Silvibacterium bohemicum]
MSSLQFGEFTLDRRLRELRRGGEVLSIPGKAFDLLSYMVSNAGRPLPKTELLDAVWPETTVEESNLSQNVFLLRKVLGSAGDGPIKTLAGRGYQFAAEVTEVEAAPKSQPPSPAQSFSSLTVEATETRMIVHDQVEERSPWTTRRRVWTSAVILLVAVGIAGGVGRQRWMNRSGEVPVPETIVPLKGSTEAPVRQAVAVLGFRDLSNHPEDAWLSTAVAEMLASEMSAGDKLRVLPSEEIARAQSDLAIKDSPIDSESKRASLRQATGADTLIQGSYVVVGEGQAQQLRLMVKAVDARSGKQLASLSETGRMGELFVLVDQAGGELRKNFSQSGSRAEGEQALSGMSHNTEALRLYAEGLERERAFDAHGAHSFFERAIEADPQFAMAHLGLADVWSDLGFMERASREAAEAYKLATGLPRAERLAVEADYKHFSQDDEGAIALYKSLSTFYPDDEKWGLKLASLQSAAGRQKDALDTLERLHKLQLTPAETVELDGIEGAAYAYIDDPQANDKARARLKEAIATADRQGGLFIHGRALRWECFALSHIGPVPPAQAACNQLKRTFQAIGDLQGVESATNNLGVLAQQVGDWKQAEADYEDARRLDHQVGNLEAEVDTIQNLAHLDLSQGELAKAIRESIELSHITGTSDDYHTAYEGHHYASAALLLSGRLSEAKVEALKAQESVDKENPQDFKIYQQARSRDDRAWVAYRAGDVSDARALFQQALAIVEPTHDDVGEAIFVSDEAWVALGRENPGNEFMEKLRHAAAVLSKLQDESDETIDAEVILARLDVQEGARDEGAQAMAKARMLDSKGDSLDVHIDVLLGDADVQQSLGHTAEAKRILQDEITVAKGHGFAYSNLAGEIMLAKLDAKIAPSPQNSSHLQSLIQEAKRAGFGGLIQQGR